MATIGLERRTSGSPDFAARRHGLGKPEIGFGIDVYRFHRIHWEHDRMRPNPMIVLEKALPTEDVNIGVLLQDGIQVLRAEHVGGVVVHRLSVGPEKPLLERRYREKRIGFGRREESRDRRIDGTG